MKVIELYGPYEGLREHPGSYWLLLITVEAVTVRAALRGAAAVLLAVTVLLGSRLAIRRLFR